MYNTTSTHDKCNKINKSTLDSKEVTLTERNAELYNLIFIGNATVVPSKHQINFIMPYSYIMKIVISPFISSTALPGVYIPHRWSGCSE